MKGAKLYKVARKYIKDIDWTEKKRDKQEEKLGEGVDLLLLLLVDVAETLDNISNSLQVMEDK